MHPNLFKILLGSAVGVTLLNPLTVQAGDKVLVMGDSLTKEYRSEFVALYPTNPSCWSARNWIELLDARRNNQFDAGSWEVFTDWRLTGHEFNWAKPGGTAREFRNLLRQDTAGKAEMLASSPLFTSSNLSAWRSTFNGLIPQSQRLVIFFGGNDLALGNSDPEANPLYEGSPKQIDYESIYAGTFQDASDPGRLRTSIRKNLLSIVQYFRNPVNGNPARYPGPMVLCGVPHVGCTPKVQRDAGTDPVRTAVLTSMIEDLNNDLRAMAVTFDIGFADIYPVTKQILDPGTFQIGGVSFIKEADPDCGNRYLFSGDGFHPNTPVQAKVAQIVADAFTAKYTGIGTDIPRLTDREIITEVLGLPGDIGYVEWMNAAGVPVAQRGPLSDPDKDGMPNVLEYVLAGRSAKQAEPTAPFSAVREPLVDGLGETLTVTWMPRFPENAYADIIPQTSSGSLANWQPVEPSLVVALPDGSRQVRLAVAEGNTLFFRLTAVRPE